MNKNRKQLEKFSGLVTKWIIPGVFIIIASIYLYKPVDISLLEQYVGYDNDGSITAVFNKGTENEVSLNLEVAKTPLEKSKGLMYRDELDSFSGMYFPYLEGREVAFWMKNMNFPLDLIYLDKDGTVLKIHKNVNPCQEQNCARYLSDGKVYGVIEVNAEFTAVHNVKIGDNVEIRGYSVNTNE